MPPRHPRLLPSLRLAVVATLLVLALGTGTPAAADASCTIAWDGGHGTAAWRDARNWDADRLPATADVVCIPAGASVTYSSGTAEVAAVRGAGSLSVGLGALTIRGDSSLGSLAVGNGTALVEGALAVGTLTQTTGNLQGAGTITAHELSWTGGSQAGTGTTRVEGTAALAGGSHTLAEDRTLEIDSGAVATWTAGDTTIRDSAELRNAGLFEIRGDQDFRSSGSTANAQIVNRAGGTLRKAAGADDTVSFKLANQGSLEVASGTLTVLSGELGGSQSVGAGATLRLAVGTTDLTAGSSTTTSGDGRVLFGGGVVHVAGDYSARTVVNGAGTLWFDVPVTLPRLELVSGNVSGAGSLTTADLAWRGGVLQGDGRATIVPGGPGVVVSGAGTQRLERRTLSIEPGAALRVADGGLSLSLAARIENSGRIELGGGSRIELCCDQTPVVHNLADGVVTKAGAGRADITTGFVNEGTVEVEEDGTLGFSVLLANLATRVLSGGSWEVRGTLDLPDRVQRNAARLTLDGPGSAITERDGDALRELVANDAAGRLALENGRSLTVPAFENRGEVVVGEEALLHALAGYLQHAGTTMLMSPQSIVASSGARAEVRGGVLGGIGTVTGGLVNGGEVRPGLPVGRLGVAGGYEQTSSGVLAIEVAGRGEAEHDWLEATGGAARLAGTLRLSALDHFLPEGRDEFELIRHDSVDGEFEATEGIQVSDTHAFPPPDYVPTGTWLRAKPTPDPDPDPDPEPDPDPDPDPDPTPDPNPDPDPDPDPDPTPDPEPEPEPDPDPDPTQIPIPDPGSRSRPGSRPDA